MKPTFRVFLLAASVALSGTSLARAALVAPGGISAQPQSSTSIILAWSDANSGESGYQIERSLSSASGFTLLAGVGGDVTSYLNGSLTSGTTYYYRVRAYSGNGRKRQYSAYSSVASATTPIASPSPSPGPSPSPSTSPSVSPTPAPTTSGCNTANAIRVVNVSTATQLGNAMRYAQPGDFILMADGTYVGNSSVFTSSVAGTASNPITLCGTRKAVITTGSLSGSGYAIVIRGNYWVLDGFTVTNSQQGVRFEGSSYSIARNLEIYNIGQEALNNHKFSSYDIFEYNVIHDTGRVTAEYGEAIYIGSYHGVWATLTGGLPDKSDFTIARFNTLGPNVTAEHFDIKEGTSGGVIEGNTIDGRGETQSQTWVDSWMELKGNGYTISNNKGAYGIRDGYQVEYGGVSGWGSNNVFSGNTANGPGTGYGIRINTGSGNVVKCSNVVSGFSSGYSNVTCSP